MRRLSVAIVLAACLALAGGGVAAAQEDVQTLPDPNAAPGQGEDGNGSGSGENGGSADGESGNGGSAQAGGSDGAGEGDDALPQTGLSALLLAAMGMTLVAAGIAARPIARRRRRYTSDTWVDLVRAGPGA